MIAYYGTEISPNQIETAEGFLICKNVPIARIGVMDYRAGDLGLSGDPDRIIQVNRREEDVFEQDALASFEGKPVTDGHPTEGVESENFAAYSKGHAQNVRRDGDYVVADLYINDSVLISEVRNGVKREVSCGYMCKYIYDDDGYRQTKIRGNHVAIVPRGRAGHEVSIKDENKEGGENRMGKMTKGLLKLFGAAAKESEAGDIDEMTTAIAAVLDAVPAEKAQEAEPTEEKKESKEPEKEKEAEDETPDNDGLEEKIDALTDMLSKFIGAFGAKGKEEKHLADESDIDKAINEGESETSDAAIIDVLKKVRPAVAAIADKEERARVADALLSAIKGEEKTAEIVSAAKDAAENTRKKSYEDICREQKAAYDALNPHKKGDK